MSNRSRPRASVAWSIGSGLVAVSGVSLPGVRLALICPFSSIGYVGAPGRGGVERDRRPLDVPAVAPPLWGIVPSTLGRADRPSAQKRLVASGVYFGWLYM